VANLTNNKDVFTCILRFRARAGYLQTYETLLKELQSYQGPDGVEPNAEPADQYAVECIALADRNLNFSCKSETCYPSLNAKPNRQAYQEICIGKWR
jgi:hypothetical protein